MTVKGLSTNKLIEAIHAGSLMGVINALNDGEDIEMADMHGYAGLPLRAACFDGDLAIVRELLGRGANPNAMASDGPGAPLRLALRTGHHDIVDLLLSKGAVVPEGVVVCPVVLDPPLDHLPIEQAAAEAAGSSAPEKPDNNIIEFTSVDLPIDDTVLPNQFGTATSVLSMDLLFLDESDKPAKPNDPKYKA
ncbi:MAG: ankyrin repeat protein [Proteobacteria bacterium]|nr:ankyrin repeat protein [Pseudomonadota bacterium]